ncbi:uncharacterized protein E0L32_006911 [Thyridium curvatum]|uniref:Uncharacterized protein n=1 Tax=Thyridium curvatum TaxID=1093900 RepID=A0A507B566_9PEZI|nr:uncharacterized protein E0L32_006911 [Thyridium curvatum]TPX12499.1 hypothetical protein E0L32_006911 [Thyridium curvatum]
MRERLPSWVPDWGVQIPDYSPFFKQKPSTPHEPLCTADKVLVFAPLGYRTVKDISAVLPHWSEYPPDFLAELKSWRTVDENARDSLREHQGWDPLKKSGMWKLPKFIEDNKQWRNVMRKVWKGFVQPLKPHDEQAFVYEQLMHSMDLGHLYWLVDRYFPREEDENQSSLEEDCPGRQFRLYRGEDDNLSFITADARPRDLVVDACSFRPPKGSITGIHGEGLVQTIKCTNFLDRGMGSSKERFATHNQRTFFLDRGGTLIIRPSPQSADDNLDHAIRTDFIDEVKLRNGVDVATPDPECWNIHLCHFILVGRHDEHDEEPLYRCWWDSGMDAWYDKGGKPVKATQAEGFTSATDGMPWPEPLASTVDEYWEDANVNFGYRSQVPAAESHASNWRETTSDYVQGCENGSCDQRRHLWKPFLQWTSLGWEHKGYCRPQQQYRKAKG